jgi:tetratricopeptide (TPR) repeat protein
VLLSINFSVFCQTSVSYRQQAWELGDNLSRAALVNAMSGDSALVRSAFAPAEANAKNLKIILPPLPAKTGDKIKDHAAALNYLLNVTGMPIMKILSADFGAKHAALFELAFKTNILLMLPDGKEAQAIIDVINKRYETAGLTAGTFAQLKRLIETQSSYEEIKKEIFSLQKLVSMFVAADEFSENGEILYARKDYAGSIGQFSQALRISPEEPKFFFMRARSYMQNNRFVEAISDYTQAIKFSETASDKKNLPTIYHNRGLCYALTKKYPLALADLNMAIKFNPEYASAYKMRSLVYKQTGNLKLAAADYQKAEKLQPGIMN